MANKRQRRANFRKMVFERDNYRCKVCGVEGVDRQAESIEDKRLLKVCGFIVAPLQPLLDAHHITPRQSMPNGGYSLSNGITLCTPCHLAAEDGKIPSEELYALIDSSLEKALADSEEASPPLKGKQA